VRIFVHRPKTQLTHRRRPTRCAETPYRRGMSLVTWPASPIEGEFDHLTLA
jgi:hypothetical protein